MKKILLFLAILLPWFLSGILFSGNLTYFDQLSLPWFALPKGSYGFAWTILYFLIAISIYTVITKCYVNYEKDYKKAILYNYLFNQLFLFFTFTLQNLFLGFIDTVLIFITSLFLYYETKELCKKASYFLIPYVLFNLYAVILMLTVYFMNL